MVSKSTPLKLACELGAQRWPDVRLPLDRFAEHLSRSGIDELRLTSHAADLFLVAACLSGDERAIAHLDREYLSRAVPAIARVDGSPSFIDEVRQQLRVRLLTGEKPRLARYQAAGRLIDWIRVAAVRIALNAKRADQRMLPTEDVPLSNLLGETDREIDALRPHYVHEVQGALEACFRELAVRERNLLRLHFLDGLSLDTLATMHGVHRATIARWLVSIRRSLVERARTMLGGPRGLSAGSVRSLYRWLARDVHLSVSRLLAQEPPVRSATD